jgi:hypothetical protein
MALALVRARWQVAMAEHIREGGHHLRRVILIPSRTAFSTNLKVSQ